MDEMSTSLEAGSDLAGFRIERLLARGGMGVVYLAQDTRLMRPVAIKVVKAELADDPRFRERFLRESRMAAGLDHPSIVPVYGAGEANGLLYLAMRYVAGRDLRTVLRDEAPLAPERALRIVGQVAGALDAAHAAGLVHRDVKPGNILLAGDPSARNEHAYLADFGLAKRPATADSATGSGAMMGTLAYAAPEQIEGAAVDGRADIYSLACVLFECLAGHPPFPADSDLGVVYAHLQQQPPRVSDASGDMPLALDGVIARGLAKRPADRYPFAGDLIDAARAVFADAAGHRRGRLSLAAALVAGGAAALAGVAVYAIDRNAAPRPTVATTTTAAPVNGGALLMVDARTGQTIHKVALEGRTPGDVVVANGVVFVSEPDVDAVARIDETSAVPSPPIPVLGASELASDGDAVWAVGRADAGGLALRRLPITGGQPTQSVPLPEGAVGVAVSGSSAWYTRDRGNGLRDLVRLETDGPKVEQTIKAGKVGMLGPIVVADGTPFALAANEPDGMTELVERADLDATATTVASMPHLGAAFQPGAEAIVADGTRLWVLAQDGTIWKIDPERRIVVRTLSLGRGPWAGLVVAADGVWVANQHDDTIVRIDRTTLTPSKPVHLDGSPQAIAADGGRLLVSVKPRPALLTGRARHPEAGTLRIVSGDDIDYWDGTSYYGLAWQVEFLTCNGLLDYRSSTDPSRQLELVPGVAENYPLVSSDGRTYTFRIRRGLRFHDGRTVTAADVRATFLRNLDPDAGFEALGTGYFNDIVGVDSYAKKRTHDIAGIRVRGDRVIFRLARRDPAFPYAVAMRLMCIVPRETVHAHQATPPMMTGPFQITSAHSGASLLLRRNRYGTQNARRLGVPNMAGVDRIEVTFGYAEADQIVAVASGRADLTLDDPRTSETLNTLRAPDLARRLTSGPAAVIAYLSMNTTAGPLANRDVRRAVNLALDRRSFVRAPGVIAPYAWSGYLPRTLTEPGSPSPYPDNGDLAGARRLLVRSGMKPPVHVNLWWFAGHGDNDAVATATKTQLDRAGFDVELRPAWGMFFFGAMDDARQHVDMALGAWGADFQDPVTFLPQLLGHTDFNYGHYRSSYFDQRAAAAAAIPAGSARRAAWTRLARVVARDDAPLAVLADRDDARLHSDRVHNLVITAPKEVDLSLLQLR
jgi:serine/threonine-protein kinase